LSPIPDRQRSHPPRRIRRQLARLGFHRVADYTRWCQARGFSTSLHKNYEVLEQEWCVRARELQEAARLERVDRDPVALLADVAAGRARARDVARPRWRDLAERVEAASLDEGTQLALRRLLECVGRRGKLVLAEARFGDETLPFVDGLIGLAREHHRWIRKPDDWVARSHNARRQFASLLRHLVADYPVPAFLDAAWLRGDPAAECYRELYLRVGAGESLVGAPLPLRLTRRMVHHFLSASESLSVEQALRRGQVIALGGDEGLARAVLGSRIGDQFEYEAFWATVIAYFVDHPELDRGDVGPIVDYLHHQRFVPEHVFEAPGVRVERPAPRPNLTMRGRSAATLLREVEAWHHELGVHAGTSGSAWASSGICGLEWETGVAGKSLRVWRIRELLTPHQLAAEGRHMRHCVVTYVRSCRNGSSSIWALEQETYERTRKHLTIEVRAGRTIVQCRGHANRLPRDPEIEAMRRWARQEGLTFASHLEIRA
jgi:hypothetical protein